jgi:hypothetical protein
LSQPCFFYTKGCGHVSRLFCGFVVLQQRGACVGVAGAADGAGGRVRGQRIELREQLRFGLRHAMRQRSDVSSRLYCGVSGAVLYPGMQRRSDLYYRVFGGAVLWRHL